MAAQDAREDMMSQRDVERTLGRLLTDQDFRDKFFLDPAGASLTLGIELTPHEVEALFRVPRPALASLGARLDDRICRIHIQRSESARPGD
jgi:hypothetical protein